MATKITTGKVRFSYVNIFTPKAQDGGEPKYSVKLLIPKSDKPTVDKILAAIAEAREKFCQRNGTNALPPKPAHTLHDGDQPKADGTSHGPECRGCYVINVSSKQKPVIVDNQGIEITDPTEIYSGCYGRASINFYGYSRNGNKGISAGLLAIKKLHDGEPFGTVGSASDFDDDFTDEELDDLAGIL